MLPSSRKSSTPVTVTVWAVFQVAGVNVTLAGATAPSVTSVVASPMLTLAAGWLFSTTVKVAVPPASVVTRPRVGVTAMPIASLSVLLADTSPGFTPL